ncbi:unnamed protein product [Trichogramma brassicae]|uniref:Uncharacterized protein n=1 Tax=Trichogramma brassicae TaxID=86971 RepID=A0A6H5IQA3_9HYME|nr:unnamed protein product [Trichogramma brassicae]
MLSGVLHIAIQQGKLHENGTIERSEVKWKRVNDYIAEGRNVKQGEDYLQLNWDRRTFALNEPIDVPDSHAVTGVRFQLDQGMLRLAVRLTEFEFETGNLLQRTSFWIKGFQSKKEMDTYRQNKQAIYSRTHVKWRLKAQQSVRHAGGHRNMLSLVAALCMFTVRASCSTKRRTELALPYRALLTVHVTTLQPEQRKLTSNKATCSSSSNSSGSSSADTGRELIRAVKSPACSSHCQIRS